MSLSGAKPYAVAIADFNQDGRNDLAVALQNTGGGAAVLIQDPAASLSFGAPRLLTNDTGATAVTAGDLNQDGRPDIVVTGANLDVFFQRSDGGFDSALELAAGARPSAVLIHDFDGDGFNDLLAVNAGEMDDGSGSAVSCWKQDPTHPGQFPTKQVYPVPNGGRDLALLPATNGPDPDFAVVSIVYGSQSPSSVTIFRNQGGGNFAAGQILTGPFLGSFVAAGDFNTDGLVDVIVNDVPYCSSRTRQLPGPFYPVRSCCTKA